MSIILDFYKGNGRSAPNIMFKRMGPNWWYFKFFRLTVTKSRIDIVDEYVACLRILNRALKKTPAKRVKKKKGWGL